MLILAWTSLIWAPSIIDLTSRRPRYRWPAVASVAVVMIALFGAINASLQPATDCAGLEEINRTLCWKESTGLEVLMSITTITMIAAAFLASAFLLTGCLTGHKRETRKVAH
jgi:hypothetical protein